MIDRILDKLGIELNDMQQDAMQAVLHTDRDVVVLSPTGSGKTLAYLLPLSQLIDAGDDEPQAIVVTLVESWRCSLPPCSRIWVADFVPWLVMEVVRQWMSIA